MPLYLNGTHQRIYYSSTKLLKMIKILTTLFTSILVEGTTYCISASLSSLLVQSIKYRYYIILCMNRALVRYAGWTFGSALKVIHHTEKRVKLQHFWFCCSRFAATLITPDETRRHKTLNFFLTSKTWPSLRCKNLITKIKFEISCEFLG